ncbi:MAG: CRISPR-associated endonuclease Cas3'' [Thermoprotei archaeon]|nr:MAG: CRISPR-associated endonuclease Cas3'' [Thermoprotei archaeon]
MNMGYPRLCAFYKDKQCIEYLDTHLTNVAIISANIVSKSLHGKIYEEMDKLALISGLLHDIGKAMNLYQKEPGKGFSGHELVSAIIAYNIIVNKCIDIEEKSFLPIIYAILVHHQAQDPLPWRVSNLGDRLSNIDNNKLFPDLLDKLLLNLLEKFGLKVFSEKCIRKAIESSEATLLNNIHVIPRRHSYVRKTGLNKEYMDIVAGIEKMFPLYNEVLDSLEGEEYITMLHILRILSGILMISDKYVSVICRGDREKALSNPYYISIEKMINTICKEEKLICN